MKKHHLTMCAGIALLLGSGVSARADYTFTFDGITNGTNATVANIQTYMNGVLGGASTVTLNAGVHADHSWNGDGHVVGPGNGNTSLNLGNTNGATSSNNTSTLTPGTTDLFLANTSDGASSVTDRVVITFSTALSGVFSFDWEIFPDGTCPSLGSCGAGNSNLPDLTFTALNASNVVLSTQHFTGVVPGIAPIGSTKSPDSLSHSTSANEAAPQNIGTFTTGYLTNVKELDFIDWPATIGIDNLKITTPEPSGVAFMLGGLALALAAGKKLRKGLAKS